MMERSGDNPRNRGHLSGLLTTITFVRNRRKIIAQLDSLQEENTKLQQEVGRLSAEIEKIRHGTFEKRRQGHFIPPIILNTMPKSGSIYLMNTLADSLGIEFMMENVSHGFFPDYYPIPGRMARFTDGRVVRQEHFDAKPLTINWLGRYTDRMILHLRDPRQATLSWLHHANRLAREHPDACNYTVHSLPQGYLEWPFDRQLDWQIETHMASLAAWLRGWLSYVDGAERDLRVMTTRYEDMVADELGFFARVLEFYGIPDALFVHRPAEKTLAHNYRRGEPGEWLRVFSSAQKARSVDLIGRDILAHFNWPVEG